MSLSCSFLSACLSACLSVCVDKFLNDLSKKSVDAEGRSNRTCL